MQNDFFREQEKWQQIRKKGKLLYGLRWTMYMLVFLLFVQGVLYTTGSRPFNSNLIAIIAVSFIVGIGSATIRWMIFERRFTNEQLN